ncbi:hypothetical protein KFK09_019696 [Dendrobium nobile]|uniref:ACT domain-containing protein ACR n=1 Tax=Dendrobium nobile TaxID=94219 RepID=A0A8T3AQW5_DENNO|nr:hypothetical protein KFK09_019696 [Dendrobium nobile]
MGPNKVTADRGFLDGDRQQTAAERATASGGDHKPEETVDVGGSLCVDNETFEDCTLLNVEGENAHGILLQIVQALSISKASISADSGWFMNVFHVTDHHGHRLREPSFIRYMQRSLDGDQEGNGSYDIAQLKICCNNKFFVEDLTSDCIALEISYVDCPDIFSEVTAVLFELSCMVDTGEVGPRTVAPLASLIVSRAPKRANHII